MITEIATFELTSPDDLSDPSSTTRSTICAFLTAVLTTDSGARAAYFGQSAENPDTVILFIDWDSTDAHHRFLASPTHDDLASPVLAIMNRTSPPQIIHLPPIPHALVGEQADINVTEVLFYYFPSSLTDEDIAAIDAEMDVLRPSLESSEPKGVFEGWAEEGDVVFQGLRGEERCKVWVHVVGWEDMAAHGRMVGEEEFEDSREMVMGMHDLKGMVMLHTALVEV
ncbi:hypothetical protein VE04_03756 [Pseudogymnoascus sp. 24MN13]|nr:hypothetical protein VE04_03756 [Pseudogymnoascus sp. 24MN13]